MRLIAFRNTTESGVHLKAPDASDEGRCASQVMNQGLDERACSVGGHLKGCMDGGRVEDVGFRVWGSGSMVWGLSLGCRVWGLVLRV